MPSSATEYTASPSTHDGAARPRSSAMEGAVLLQALGVGTTRAAHPGGDKDRSEWQLLARRCCRVSSCGATAIEAAAAAIRPASLSAAGAVAEPL